MATRTQLEQQALRFIQRGQPAKAVDVYHRLLVHDPRDRRIRQKLGELYLKLGRDGEGLKLLKEVADQARRDGQPRAAVAMYMQLIKLQPDDHELGLLLGDSYKEAGARSEAERTYETLMEQASTRRDHRTALAAGRKLLETRPNDLALRFRLSEQLEGSGDVEGAIESYRALADVLRRRGEQAELARALEALARLTDDPDMRLSAAEARLATGEPTRALELAEPLRSSGSGDVRTLRLLAEASAGAGRSEEAAGFFRALADSCRSMGDTAGQARALKRALETGGEDPSLREAMEEASRRATQLQARLWDSKVLAPSSDDEVRVCTRVEVLLRYGLASRALDELEAARESAPGAICLGVRQVEVLLDLGRKAEALDLLEAIATSASGQSRRVMEERLSLLGGAPLPDEEMPIFDAPPDLLIEEDDDFLEEMEEGQVPERVEGAPGSEASSLGQGTDSWGSSSEDLAERDFLTRAHGEVKAGRLEEAAGILQEAYRQNPMSNEILIKLAEVRQAQREQRAAPPPPALPPVEEEGLEELPSDVLDSLPPDSLDDGGDLELPQEIMEAWYHLEAGLLEDALELARSVDGLGARLVEARVLAATGEKAEARSVLATGLAGAQESDPLYPDAMLELAAIYRDNGRLRAAMRLLEELEELRPGWRTRDVAARKGGLALLLARNG